MSNQSSGNSMPIATRSLLFSVLSFALFSNLFLISAQVVAQETEIQTRIDQDMRPVSNKITLSDTVTEGKYKALEYFDFSSDCLKLILSRAETGDPYAQGLYGGLALWGYVVDPSNMKPNNTSLETTNKVTSRTSSDEWFGAAEEKVSAPVQSSEQLNKDWIELSAAAQSPIGIYFKAYRLENTKEIRNVVELRDLWKNALVGLTKLADKNDPVALTLLGLMYERGLGVNASLANAKNYYQKGAECKSALAAYNLSLLIIDDSKATHDYAKIKSYIDLAVAGKVKNSQELKTEIYDKEKAFLLDQKLKNPVIKVIFYLVSILFSIVGLVFGWKVFPYCLAPIEFLLRSEMNLLAKQVGSAIPMGIIGFLIGGAIVIKLVEKIFL